jgi:integrase
MPLFQGRAVPMFSLFSQCFCGIILIVTSAVTNKSEDYPMKAKVAMLARINRKDLRFPYAPVQFKKNAVKFPILWTPKRGGELEFDKDSVMGFYARFQNNGVLHSEALNKRIMHPLGKDVVAAYIQFQNLDQDFERIERGLMPVNIPTDVQAPLSKYSLVQAAAKYKQDLTAESKEAQTIHSYMAHINNFIRFYESRPNLLLNDITADDLRNFLLWLPKNIRLRPGSGGHINNTLRNHLRDIKIMMSRFGISFPLEKKYWPKEVPKRKRKYSIDSIKAMLKACDRPERGSCKWASEDERDLIHFLVNTGFRDREVAHAQYGDINFKKGSINVYAKPEFKWKPKDKESRQQDIDLSPRFLQRIKDRKKRYHATDKDLIFPNSSNRPHMNGVLLDVVRRLIKYAGLEEKAGLHIFRKTFGTMIANARGLEQARIWLGHEDVATTQDYLAADEWTSDEDSMAKQQVIFDAIGD